MFMPKTPISVTLDEENLLWLRARARTGKARSVSEALDLVLTAARQSGYGVDMRSIAGTVDIASTDPALLTADAELQALFDDWRTRASTMPGATRGASPSSRRRKAARA
jgi:hypothetical protein